MEREFSVSVGPYYGYIDHHRRQSASEVIRLLSDGNLVRKPSGGHSRITPLDLFSLPFRHLRLSEPLITLAFEYGVRCAFI